MTYLRTAAGNCPRCDRVLFTTHDGLWPRHFNLKLATRAWCVASDTLAPTRILKAVVA